MCKWIVQRRKKETFFKHMDQELSATPEVESVSV